MASASSVLRVAAGLAAVLAAAGCSLGADATSDEGGDGTAQAAAVLGAPCQDVYYERPGVPDLLIVSDLPAHGGESIDTAQMTQAVKLVLKYHYGFRAGRFTVGYQVCGAPRASRRGGDRARCAARARAYARAGRLVGVIGTLDSSCARVEVPVLNAARAGPVAVVSPTNTYPGLTRSGPGTARDEPGRYAASGAPSYARVALPDDAQGRATVRLLEELGALKPYVLRGPGAYAAAVAGGFEAAAAEHGMIVAGRATWRPESVSQVTLADRVARTGADAVVVAGRLSAGGGSIVRALRDRTGPDVTFVLSDGFTPVPELVAAAGDAADGAYLTVGVQPVETLSAAGQAFADEFRSKIGRDPGPYTVHAAQAAEVLLAAIGRSDGSRASVAASLFGSEFDDGPLAPLAIDEHGDAVGLPVVVYRLERGRPVRWGTVNP